MVSKLEYETLFKSEAYADSFKRGEMVTYPFAQMLIEQSKLATDSKAQPNQPLVVLDNACGTGVVSSIINQKLDPLAKKGWKLTCGDISPAVLQYTQHRMETEDWQNAETKIVDAQESDLPSAFYTHIFTAFAYMALPESLKGLDETVRMLKPGGTIAFSTWIEPGWVSVARQAIQKIPGNLPFPETSELMALMSDGKWNSVPWIESQLKQRGFQDINVRVETNHIALESSLFVDMIMLVLPTMMKTLWDDYQLKNNEKKVRVAIKQHVEETYGSDRDVETNWVAIISTARKAS